MKKCRFDRGLSTRPDNGPKPRFPGAAAKRAADPPPPIEAVATEGDARPSQMRDPIPLPLVFRALGKEHILRMIAANQALERILSQGQLSDRGLITSLPAEGIAAAVRANALKARSLIDNAAFASDCHRLVILARRIPASQALGLLALLGFLASSERRHAAAAGQAGAPPLPAHLAVALLELGDAIGHDPRDAADTAWLMQPPFTWTATRRELLLGTAVRQIEARFSETLALLEPVLKRRRTLADARHDLISASNTVQELLSLDGVPDLGAEVAFAPYLQPFEVMATEYPGPNPMQTPGWRDMTELVTQRRRLFRFHYTVVDILRETLGLTVSSRVDPGLEAAKVMARSLYELRRRMALGLPISDEDLLALHVSAPATPFFLPGDNTPQGTLRNSQQGKD